MPLTQSVVNCSLKKCISEQVRLPIKCSLKKCISEHEVLNFFSLNGVSTLLLQVGRADVEGTLRSCSQC